MNLAGLRGAQKARLRKLLKSIEVEEERFLILSEKASEEHLAEENFRLENEGCGLYPDRVLKALDEGWPAELELPLTVGDAQRFVSRRLDEMAGDLVDEILKSSELLIPKRSEREKALGHVDVLSGWPLLGKLEVEDLIVKPGGLGAPWVALYVLLFSAELADRVNPVDLPPLGAGVAGCWPDEIAFQPVARWVQKNLKRTVVRLEDRGLEPLLMAHAEENLLLAEQGRLPLDLILSTTSGSFRLSAVGSALLSHAHGRSMEVMAIDTGWVHHNMLGKWRDLPKDNRRHRGDVGTARGLDVSRVELVAPGKDLVKLTVERDLLHDDFVAQLRRWWGWEGLRHWAALQRLFSVEGGRRGKVRWTLNDHLDAMGYNERSIFNPVVRARAAETVEAMTKIELAVYNHDGTLRMRKPILVKGGTYERLVDSRWELDGLELGINEFLYEGVRRPSGRVGRDWFPVPVNLARLDHSVHPHALALGLLIPIRLRWRIGDDYRDLVISGESLLRLGGFEVNSTRMDGAWEKLDSSLRTLRSIHVIDSWEWRGGIRSTESYCQITAPLYLVEQITKKRKWPDILPLYVPMTGAELREWRHSQGRSQVELAELLGVSERTVRRAEERTRKALTKRMVRLLKRRISLGKEEGRVEDEFLRL